jgi:catechol 2,3-dioxygenase-like lactoylglutathione lyase family enzyme
MSIEYVFAGVAVARLETSIRWYERFLGRPPDVLPNEREAMWQLVDTASIYLVADQARAGKSAVTLFVDDLDRHLEAITERGIASGSVETAPGLYRKCVVTDPDGNVIQLGENLNSGGRPGRDEASE